MILVAGQKVEATEALQWGLVDRIVESGDLLDAAKSLAEDVVVATPEHAAAIKAMLG